MNILACAALALLAAAVLMGALYLFGFRAQINPPAPEPRRPVRRCKVRAGQPYCDTSTLGLSRIRQQATEAARIDFARGVYGQNPHDPTSRCGITYTTTYGIAWLNEQEKAERCALLPTRFAFPRGIHA